MILTTSPEMIPLKSRLAILELEDYFFASANYIRIHTEEVDSGFKWSTVVPYMKLAYHPYPNPRKSLVCASYSDADIISMRKLDRSAKKEIATQMLQVLFLVHQNDLI